MIYRVTTVTEALHIMNVILPQLAHRINRGEKMELEIRPLKKRQKRARGEQK